MAAGSMTASAMGSSPLARGLRSRLWVGVRRNWIIPARAGFTAQERLPRGDLPDHPRSRGVYRKGISFVLLSAGSSPLARGLLRPRTQPRRMHGIIPARAGFTTGTPARRRRARDHPRSRGVYRPHLLGPPISMWIIPARAGFTRGHAPGLGAPTDHPRSRGVYRVLIEVDVPDQGSSPLARGLLGDRNPSEVCDRIIPARAGFTRPAPPPSATCGGSSPLARGLLLGRCWVISSGWIIPARAGFTAVHYVS